MNSKDVVIHPTLAEKLQITKDEILEAQEPEWEKTGRVHDWRNYVIVEIQELWSQLDLITRVLLIRMAEERALNEHWD